MRPDLIAASFSVLAKHKQLIVFPVLSAVSAIFVILAFGGFGMVAGLFANIHRMTGLHWLLVFGWYCASAFGALFFNCALAACAQECLNGGNPTVSFGIRRAFERVDAILAWAVLTSTVGIILNFIERRVPLAGKIGVWLFGAAWGMASYLVVPVLIIESRDAVDSLRRSTQLLRETWGDQLTAVIRYGWRFLLLLLPAIVIGAIGVKAFLPLLGLAFLYFVALIAAFSAAGGIFRVALYRYAADGSVPEGWSQDWMSSAFRNQRG